MNVKKLIEKIEGLNKLYGEKFYVALDDVLDLVKQLDEPEKVKVSEEEAKFLETFDFNCEIDVTEALYYVSRTGWGYHLTDKDNTELKHLSEGFRELENRKRLIKAILDGYEVEKEKRYRVKMKGNIEADKLVYGNFVEKYFFAQKSTLPSVRNYHTKKQLEKAGFGWVFDCEGIDIEEVEG